MAKEIAAGRYIIGSPEAPSWKQIVQNQEEIIRLLHKYNAPSELPTIEHMINNPEKTSIHYWNHILNMH